MSKRPRFEKPRTWAELVAPRLRGIQFRFPRSKRKRIRNKWKSDPRNFRKIGKALLTSTISLDLDGNEHWDQGMTWNNSDPHLGTRTVVRPDLDAFFEPVFIPGIGMEIDEYGHPKKI